MPTVYQLLQGSFALRVVHAGKRLIVGTGEDQIVQTFPNEDAAAEHLQHMLSRRRREGYRVEASEVTDPNEAGEADPLANVLKWDPERKRVTVTLHRVEAAARMCEAALARMVRLEPACLHLVCDPASPGVAFSSTLAKTPLPSVQRLILDTPFQTVTRQRLNNFGDLTDALAGLPNLTDAFLTGDLALRPTVHATLRRLYLLGDPLPERALAALGKSRFPSLQSLGLTLARDASPNPAAAAAALLAVQAPQLATIDVGDVGDPTEFLAALTAGPLPPTWNRLSIGGAIDDEDALLELLAARAPALRSLHILGLPLTDELSEPAAARAQRLVPALVDREELADRMLPATYEEW